MANNEPPIGQRYDLVYLPRGEPTSDSETFRNRLGAYVDQRLDHHRTEIGAALERELGVKVPRTSVHGFAIGRFLEKTGALWTRYRELKPELRRQFLQATAKWQEALAVWHDRRTTLSFALMVIACEALKPAGHASKGHNIYGVVEALLGRDAAERLRKNLFDADLHPGAHPQSIRSAHLHRGSGPLSSLKR